MAPIFGVSKLVICVIILSFTGAATKESKSLSLSIISILSKASPFYQANLTQEERLRQISDSSYARAMWLSSSNILNHTNNTTTPDMVRADVRYHATIYYVHVKIGTPPRYYYLQLDTGSSLSWVQCEGCDPCMEIRPNFNFNPRLSSTFGYLSCEHPLCNPRRCSDDNKCLYEITYVDGLKTAGMLGGDIFELPSSEPGRGDERVNGVVFGCGTKNTKQYKGGPTNVISGILGIGRGPESFMSQLGAQAQTQNRFSYCLPDIHRGKRGFLRFGSDAVIQGQVRSTPLLYMWPVQTHDHYYVDLQAISVDGTRLNIPPEAFHIGFNGTRGVALDVGSGMTYLRPGAYGPLEAALNRYFSQFGIRKLNIKELLCYPRPTGFNTFPSIQFHFDGADWDVKPGSAFILDQQKFCLLMKSTSEFGDFALNIMGAYFQANYRVLYDLRANRIYFKEEDCDE